VEKEEEEEEEEVQKKTLDWIWTHMRCTHRLRQQGQGEMPRKHHWVCVGRRWSETGGGHKWCQGPVGGWEGGEGGSWRRRG